MPGFVPAGQDLLEVHVIDLLVLASQTEGAQISGLIRGAWFLSSSVHLEYRLAQKTLAERSEGEAFSARFFEKCLLPQLDTSFPRAAARRMALDRGRRRSGTRRNFPSVDWLVRRMGGGVKPNISNGGRQFSRRPGDTKATATLSDTWLRTPISFDASSASHIVARIWSRRSRSCSRWRMISATEM